MDEDPWRQKESTSETNDDDAAAAAENPDEVLRECAEKFATPDYIMEPGIFQQLKRYFQAGGDPANVIDELSKNYIGVAQITNLLAEYLIISGTEARDVQSMVENHMKDLIVKNFDPKKADTIFTEEGETPAWLTELIKHNTWRSLIYRLAEEYGDCLMLNFTVKLIADAGYQGEITSITTAAQQIEVFSRVIKTSVLSFLKNLDNWQKSSQDFSKMVCFGQHTYVYSQVLLQILSKESNGGNYMKRLSQEIARHAKEIGYDVTAVTMSLNGTSVYTQACEALSSMLSRNTLNPADISVLFRSYSSDDPPPVELIRNPHFLELLIQALFKAGFKINPEHKSKYVFMLAFATSVYEIVTKKTATKFLNKDDLEATIAAIETVHQIVNSSKGSSELIVDVGTLYQALRFPVVSLGIIKWVEFCVTEPSYFQLSTEHCPTHLALLDEICTSHPLLHEQVLELLITLFESKHDNLEILVQLEKRKMLLDRMIHLLCSGHVIPVVKYVKKCWQNNDTDMSLIRYFVTEVLDSIGPPYTAEFVREFLPMVSNEEITGSMRGGCDDYVSEFICHCNVHYR